MTTTTGALTDGMVDGVRPPRVRAYDDEVWLQGPRSLSEWLSAWFDGHEHYDVTLHPSVAWEVVVRGGVCGLHGRLDDVDLARVEFSRTHWPFLRDRRVDAYGGLVRRFGDEG